MKLGNLDRYIAIESYIEVADSYGEKIKTWETYHSCYANRSDTGGGETVTAAQITGRLNVNWTIRYKSGINEKMRISYDGQYYQITAIMIEGKDKRMIVQSYRL